MTRIRFTGILTALAAALLFAAPAPAKETKKQDAAPAAANPYLAQIDDMAKDLAGKLSPEEAEALGLVRHSFGLVRSVGVVRRNVEHATGLCLKANPDMKTRMGSRFETWNAKIVAALDEQDRNLKRAAGKENFRNPAAVKAYLDLLDKAGKYAEDRLDVQVVTTPEACARLQQSMDETETVLTGLIRDIKWPSPSAADPADEATPAAAKDAEGGKDAGKKENVSP